jgi:hypothetical protein
MRVVSRQLQAWFISASSYLLSCLLVFLRPDTLNLPYEMAFP